MLADNSPGPFLCMRRYFAIAENKMDEHTSSADKKMDEHTHAHTHKIIMPIQRMQTHHMK